MEKKTHSIISTKGLQRLVYLTVGGLATPLVALGQSSKLFSRQTGAGSTVDATLSGTGLGSLSPYTVATGIIYYILTILAVIAVALIIYGGFIWLFSRGNEEEVTKAKDILKASVIGLLIILAAYGSARYIFYVIEGTTGQTV